MGGRPWRRGHRPPKALGNQKLSWSRAENTPAPQHGPRWPAMGDGLIPLPKPDPLNQETEACGQCALPSVDSADQMWVRVTLPSTVHLPIPHVPRHQEPHSSPTFSRTCHTRSGGTARRGPGTVVPVAHRPHSFKDKDSTIQNSLPNLRHTRPL